VRPSKLIIFFWQVRDRGSRVHLFAICNKNSIKNEKKLNKDSLCRSSSVD